MHCTPQKCANGDRPPGPPSLRREPTPPPWIESVSHLTTPPPWIESVSQLCTLAPSLLISPDLVHPRLFLVPPLFQRWSYGMPFEDHSLVRRNLLRVHEDGHPRCVGICGKFSSCRIEVFLFTVQATTTVTSCGRISQFHASLSFRCRWIPQKG